MNRLIARVERTASEKASEGVDTTYYINLIERAEALLVILEERKREENNQKQLLRGSSEPASSPSELLRAAPTHVAEEAPEQLLRASHAMNPDEER